MTFRRKLSIFSITLVVVPLLALALLVRAEIRDRLEAQYDDRTRAALATVDSRWVARSRALTARLDAWTASLKTNDTLRDRLTRHVDGGAVDVAGEAMRLFGIDFLQIQDARGKILSSGHFRNEFDRIDSSLVRWLRAQPEARGWVEARTPSGGFLALVQLDSLELGANTFYLSAGHALDEGELRELASDPLLEISLVTPTRVISTDSTVAGRLRASGPPRERIEVLRNSDDRRVITRRAQVLQGDSIRPGWFVLSHTWALRDDLLRSLDLWLAVVWGLALLVAFVVSTRMARGLSRPLESLAATTRAVDLESLEAKFPTEGRDEVGTLARFLAEMVERLRTNVGQLREAERRATVGDLARQINHDLRNGFTPIRNVVRHLSQVSNEEPGDLARIFAERESTLEEGLRYLDELANQYARLSHARERKPCDVGRILRAICEGRLPSEVGTISLDVEPALPSILADPTGLRRVFENLVTNAVESFDDSRVHVRVKASRVTIQEQECVQVVVEDDGRGMSDNDLEQVFEHFYTTKPSGSGLGLSIVRRLVSDFEGSIHVESAPSKGTRLTVSFPVHVSAARSST